MHEPLEITRLGPISSVRIAVRDLEASRRFFRECVGLDETFANAWVAQFDTGAAQLVLEPLTSDDDEPSRVGSYTGVMFNAPDVQAIYNVMAARGVEFLGPPEPMFWGAVFAHFKDLDGNVFTACQYPQP